MGTCYSSLAVVSPKKELKSLSSPPTLLQEQSSRRKGAEGLLDLGLEYRFQRCDQHKDEHQQRTIVSYKPNDVCCECSTRLFRIQDDIMITPENRKKFIQGKDYELVRQATYEFLLHILERDCHLKLINLFQHPDDNDNDNQPVQALVSQYPPSPPPVAVAAQEDNNDNTDENNMNNKETAGTLLIITGRGICRAGVLSTRYLIEAGIETGSALFHIVQAIQRNMSIVCLDPNARGSTNGMDTVFRSLSSPVLAPYLQNQPLYILAHSAAGGYLVQYLVQQPPQVGNQNNTDKATAPTLLKTQEDSDETLVTASTSTSSIPPIEPPYLVTIPQIQRLVFTDSTHNLQWLSLRQRDDVSQFLQSNLCLYIRNNREHPSDIFAFGNKHECKQTGEFFENKNSNWLKRFGNIPTVYAGTPDHSLMCYQARHVIWNFFDNKPLVSSSVETKENNDADEAPTA